MVDERSGRLCTVLIEDLEECSSSRIHMRTMSENIKDSVVSECVRYASSFEWHVLRGNENMPIVQFNKQPQKCLKKKRYTELIWCISETRTHQTTPEVNEASISEACISRGDDEPRRASVLGGRL